MRNRLGLALLLALACAHPAAPTPAVPPPPATASAAPVAAAPTSFPRGLVVHLDGPHADLDRILADRRPAPSEGCDPPAVHPAPTMQRVQGQGPTKEVVLVRVPADIACAPIEYCVLAIRSHSGWWVTPDDINGWCQGVLGPSSRVETWGEEVRVLADGRILVHEATRTVHQRWDSAVDGNRHEEWTSSDALVEHVYEITPDGTVWTQVSLRGPG